MKFFSGEDSPKRYDSFPIASTGTPMPTCKPLAKSAEEMLMKAVEYLMLGLDESIYRGDGDFTRGKIYAYEDMAAHLEILIKEAKQ